jgi:hypothetical protein
MSPRSSLSQSGRHNKPSARGGGAGRGASLPPGAGWQLIVRADSQSSLAFSLTQAELHRQEVGERPHPRGAVAPHAATPQVAVVVQAG